MPHTSPLRLIQGSSALKSSTCFETRSQEPSSPSQKRLLSLMNKLQVIALKDPQKALSILAFVERVVNIALQYIEYEQRR